LSALFIFGISGILFDVGRLVEGRAARRGVAVGVFMGTLSLKRSCFSRSQQVSAVL